jgi:hypothetical protein
MQGRCPPGLDPASTAYRFGGFGTHEIVMYYELVRHLHWSCFARLQDLVAANSPLRLNDFLPSEVPRLSRLRDEWLDTPDPESHRRTPRELIDHERRRLPEGFSGRDAMIDHDCPLCEMMAEMPGPMFMNLDGCNMDRDFAFSFHRTREEWEEEERESEEFNRRFNDEWAERERLGVKHPGEDSADADAVWQRSFSTPDGAGEPLAMRLFGIGCHLAELIVDLKTPTEDRPLIDQLSRDFGNLREVIQSGDEAMADALIEPVLERFGETLDAVAAVRSDLQAKCADLQQRLRRFLEPPGEEPLPPEPFDDEELPF